MILDKIENSNIYYGISKRLDQAFDYLKQTDFSTMDVGIHKIDGDKIFVIVNDYKTKNNELNILEAHRKYIDLQYVQSGQEIIEYEAYNQQNVSKDYDDEHDYLFYLPTEPTRLLVKQGMFAVFFPDDLHLPGLKNNIEVDIRKIVIKILIN